MQKIIFNCSLPRAGSTLMQNILAQNPRFYCSPTSSLLEMLLASRDIFTGSPSVKAQDANIMKRGWMGGTKGLLEGWYQAITDKPICVDKSRGWTNHYQWLCDSMPDVKIITCIRDLRAVLSSMEKLYRKNRHLSDPSIKPGKWVNTATVPHRVSNWLNVPPVGPAVTTIVNAVQTGIHRQLCFVRFEDLTKRPKETMEKVYDFLGEPHFEHDFEHIEQKTVENDLYYPIYGDHTIREQVRPVPADYIEVLGKEVCAEIKQGNKLYYQTFYPDLR